MIEPAIVLGVSDADKVKEAFTEYYRVADELVEILKGVKKIEIPKDFKLPRPHVYNLPEAPSTVIPCPRSGRGPPRDTQRRTLEEGGRALAFRQAHATAARRAEAMIAGITLPVDRPLAAVAGWTSPPS